MHWISRVDKLCACAFALFFLFFFIKVTLLSFSIKASHNYPERKTVNHFGLIVFPMLVPHHHFYNKTTLGMQILSEVNCDAIWLLFAKISSSRFVHPWSLSLASLPWFGDHLCAHMRSFHLWCGAIWDCLSWVGAPWLALITLLL